MSSGPGLPGSPLPLRLPAKGTGSCFTKRGRMRVGAAVRSMIPSLAPASTTATTCCSPAIGRRSPISSGSVRSIRSNRRSRRRSRSSISRTARAGRYGRRAAACRGGFFAPRGGCRERGYATTSRCCDSGEPAPVTLSRRCWIATQNCFVGYGSRWPSRRSTPRPSRLRPRFSPASSPRRSEAARPPAGRCWRVMDYRKVSLIPRWITCLATAARSASAAG